MNTLEDDFQLDAAALASLTDSIRIVDTGLSAHASRLAPLVALTLERLPAVTQADRALAQATALLHDIGKAAIPAELLLKPAALTPSERAIVRHHPAIGANLAAQMFEIEILAKTVRHHHEWWNGLGYPDGLAGGKIPLLSRVVGVADAFDAMTTDRPYRAARDAAAAIEELGRCAGTQFDPDVVQAFISVVSTG